ncbi:hypothetical protein BJV82DRAFT_579686 [Fennellomyces sp. T-0311]|nr:hypothetical protein BJV82DRAFT_579686 [Fennellomyces sp. T-0311]
MHPPYFDSDAPDYDPWDASRDPYYDWERIDEDPYMMDDYDAVAAHAPPGPPEPDYPYENERDYHAAKHKHKKKKKHHHHDDNESSASEESSSSTSEASASSSSSISLLAIDTTAAQHNAIEASTLSESPVLISSTSFSSSDDGTPLFSDVDDLSLVATEPQTSYVVSTVYAVNTMMPGSYPNIDYNAIDYSQLGQIGVFSDSARGLNVAAYWISLVVALMVVFMLRV